jgi:HD-GYP domain-containing protein (c-di-GMP phosphodiesterase class II)
MVDRIQIFDGIGISKQTLAVVLPAFGGLFQYHLIQNGNDANSFRSSTTSREAVQSVLLLNADAFDVLHPNLPAPLRRTTRIVTVVSKSQKAKFAHHAAKIASGEIFDTIEAPLTKDKLILILSRIQDAIHHADELASLRSELAEEKHNLRRLNDIGIALSSQTDITELLDLILTLSMEITHADGATLYTIEEKPDSPTETNGDYLSNKQMRFKYTKSETLASSFKEFTMPISTKSLSGYTAVTGKSLNIADVYEISPESPYGFNSSFDKSSGYRSTSMLVVPMLNRNKETIGVIQLLNKKTAKVKLTDEATTHRYVIPFDEQDENLTDSFASQAAIALENRMLIEAQKKLLESFIRLIAEAIDKKSAYTGGHCNRVPVLTEMLAEAVCKSHDPKFAGFSLTPDEWYELHIAAWLHDCGKVTTPVHVMDKSTKLETIYDRINEIVTRIEVLKKDAEIEYLRSLQQPDADKEQLKSMYQSKVAALDDDIAFLRRVNIGGEFLPDSQVDRIKAIGQQRLVVNGTERPLLNDEEIYNLSIRRGTLNAEERKIINDHIVVTLQMLEKLPFPRQLRRVPEYAGGHHEKMDGTGYPKGLTRDQMSIPARCMAIADIFEALTAEDRPYKKGKALSESMKIMAKMKIEHHIDPDLFDLFVSSGVYKAYAQKYLNPALIDNVDEEALLGIKPNQQEAVSSH